MFQNKSTSSYSLSSLGSNERTTAHSSLACQNKIAIVTGAAKGIGYGIALDLAKNGAGVVLADFDKDTNEKSAVEIAEKTGMKTLAVQCDVSKKEDIETLIKTTMEKFGAVDILVNNAG